MSSPIKTYDDLLQEKARMESLLILQKARVIDNWQAVKQELEPVTNVFGFIGKITTRDKSNPLLNVGLRLASDVVLKNFLFAKAGWVTRFAVPFLVKNYSSNILADTGKSFLGKIGRIFNKVTQKTDPSSQNGSFNASPDNPPHIG